MAPSQERFLFGDMMICLKSYYEEGINHKGRIIFINGSDAERIQGVKDPGIRAGKSKNTKKISNTEYRTPNTEVLFYLSSIIPFDIFLFNR